jgi:hypothetical protein
MGSTTSSETSKEGKKEFKKEFIQEKINNINTQQKKLIENYKQNSPSDNQIIDPKNIVSDKKLLDIFIITEKSKEQLERFDKPFTKNDLIAIIVKLKKYDLNKISELQVMTCSDLIVIIRGIIYDTNI